MNKNIFLLSIIALCACSYRPVDPDDPKYAPVMPEAYQSKVSKTGSLYTEDNTMDLYTDVTARKIGDIITVVLAENNNANLQTDTKTTRTTEIQAPNPTILGSPVQFNLPKGLPLQSPHGANIGVEISNNSAFEGKASSIQQNTLTGSIAVTVTQVWPNGTLVVRGEKWMALNQGNEFIRLTGLIRQEDIAADNTISSTKLADARIAYSGKDYIHDTNGPGWLVRAVTGVLWPF